MPYHFANHGGKVMRAYKGSTGRSEDPCEMPVIIKLSQHSRDSHEPL